MNSFPTQDIATSCWTDYCIWHISSWNQEKVIVLFSTSKYILSTESDIWLQAQTLESFAALSCTVTPRVMHMGQWVSVTCTNCALPMRAHLRRGHTTALHPWGNKILTGQKHEMKVNLLMCLLTCVTCRVCWCTSMEGVEGKSAPLQMDYSN